MRQGFSSRTSSPRSWNHEDDPVAAAGRRKAKGYRNTLRALGEAVLTNYLTRGASVAADSSETNKARVCGLRLKPMMGLEPTTFCMASISGTRRRTPETLLHEFRGFAIPARMAP